MPDPNLEELADLRTPWCLHVVATLRIAELLDSGISEIRDLASAAACDADILHGILAHLASKGLFLEHEPGRFQLSEASKALLDPAHRLGLDLNGIGGRMAHSWSTLLGFAQTGKPQYQALFGRPFWDDLATHPDVAATFDEMIGPAGHGLPNPDFPLDGGWDNVRTVVDVGGGTGAMLAELVRTRPALRGILVDLPGTVARSGPLLDAHEVAGKITTRGQSFFDPLPPGEDVYLLRGILNDWPDEEAAAILICCAEAAGRSGRVVILKSVAPDGRPPHLTIEMLLVGGKYRSLAAFRELAAASRLEIVAAQQTASGYFAVECKTR